ncbi:MAG: FHA domain-containing protein [Ardenticatenaceae bacterium]
MQHDSLSTVVIENTSPPFMVRWIKSGQPKPHEKDVYLPISLGRGDENAIVLRSKKISRHHADIEWINNKVVLIDKKSTNGTYLNGKRKRQAPLKAGDQIKIGEYTVTLEVMDEDRTEVSTHSEHLLAPAPSWEDDDKSKVSNEPGLHFCSDTDMLQPFSVLEDVTLPEIFNKPVLSIRELEQARMPFRETTYLTVGGGLGSFSWVNYLAISGVDPQQIVAMGFPPIEPYARYKQLCLNSQIPEYERLRSNSDACPDNIWGWPGYAVREVWGHFKRGDFGQAAKVSWQIFNEPIVETYTPRSTDVYNAIDREAARIGWDKIWMAARVEAIRQTDDGRYVVAYSHPNDQTRMLSLMVAPYLHIALGYPGVRFLPDLVEYRQRTGDSKSVVNAYEPHEHVYKQLIKHGGTVLVRGRGIVASRIIQRLYEVRMKREQENKDPGVKILHLMRQPKPNGQTFRSVKRIAENHWELQPFNWPKAAWGGTTRYELERANDFERDQLLTVLGGTTTADRQDWRDMIEKGRREGWIDMQFGAVEAVERNPNTGQVVTIISGQNIAKKQKLDADFIIDATGLDAALDHNPLLKDLRQTYKLELNIKGRFKTGTDFELEGLRNGSGRAYLAGVMALGSSFAPVDSFLGLQYAALRSVDSLAEMNAPGVKKINGLRSLLQWTRWARGVKP